MKKWLLVLILLVGCAKTPPVVPVEFDTETGKKYQIFTESNEGLEKLPGVKPDDVIAVISVPASTETTTVYITKEKKTVREKVARKKDEAKTPIGVISTNKNVTAEYPEVTPWWHYLAFALIIIGACIAVYEYMAKKFGWVATPFKWLIKIFTKFRR